VKVAHVTARPERPPGKRNPDRWYWRCEGFGDGNKWVVWCGRATHGEVQELLLELVRTGQADAPRKNDAPVPPVERTVEKLLKRWLAAQESRVGASAARSTFIAYKGRVNNHLVRLLGTVLVAEVSKETVVRYRDGRLREGGSTQSVHAELICLGAAWTWARERGLLRASPGYSPPQDLPSAPLEVKAKRDKYTPTPGEVAAVLDQLDPGGWPYMAVRLLHATGCRIGEIGHLRWRDVYLGADPYLRIRETKTKEDREVPIPELAEALQRWRPQDAEPEDLVLGVTPYTVSKQVGGYWLPRAIAAAKLPRPFTPHGLRRLAVDTMARAGVDVKTAAALTGHSEAVMLKLYRTVTAEDRRAAVKTAGLGRLPRGKVVPFASGQDE